MFTAVKYLHNQQSDLWSQAVTVKTGQDEWFFKTKLKWYFGLKPCGNNIVHSSAGRKEMHHIKMLSKTYITKKMYFFYLIDWFDDFSTIKLL